MVRGYIHMYYIHVLTFKFENASSITLNINLQVVLRIYIHVPTYIYYACMYAHIYNIC